MLSSPEDGVPVLRTRDGRWRRVLMPVVVLAVVGAIALLWVRQGEDGVVGSGSTLAQEFIEQSALEFRDSANADDPENPGRTARDWVVESSGISYDPVGSLGGILQLGDGKADFAISDYPLSQDALDESALAQFPIVIGSIAIAHNLDLPDGAVLQLDADVLAAIYLGQITQWNDDKIATLNPDLDLPSLSITPVHRSDGSGSTYGFTAYLESNGDWADGPGQGALVEWPTGEPAKRSGGMAAEVADTEGAIGYLEPNQAAVAGLAIAAVQNAADAYTQPTSASMSAAVSGVKWSSDDEFSKPIVTSDDAAAYPLTVAVYAMVRTSDSDAADRTKALDYLAYVVDEYDAADSGFLPLPDSAITAVHEYWADVLDYTSPTAI